MNILDVISTTSVKLAAVLTVIASAGGVVESRYAKATDFERLIDVRKFERIEYYEDEITKSEDAINRLRVIQDLSDSQKLHINQLNDRKAAYLRKIQRINKSK